MWQEIKEGSCRRSSESKALSVNIVLPEDDVDAEIKKLRSHLLWLETSRKVSGVHSHGSTCWEVFGDVVYALRSSLLDRYFTCLSMLRCISTGAQCSLASLGTRTGIQT